MIGEQKAIEDLEFCPRDPQGERSVTDIVSRLLYGEEGTFLIIMINSKPNIGQFLNDNKLK